jgi:hypothetical protein
LLEDAWRFETNFALESRRNLNCTYESKEKMKGRTSGLERMQKYAVAADARIC